MPLAILIALSTLVSEDLTCIATGVLVAQGRLGFLAGAAACFAGIFIGDLLLFLAGRFAGTFARKWPLLRRLVPADRLARASAWLSARGAPVLFLSRFTPGLRLPTYVAAGLLGTDFRRFVWYLALAAAAWTPLLIGFAALLGGQAARSALSAAGVTVSTIVAVILAWIVLRSLPVLFSFRVRRRLAGFVARKFRWEFWPPWAAYIPLIPYLAWLALKHRSPTLFTAANPGIPSGGFAGESKSRILEHLDRIPGAVAAWALIPAPADPAARIQLTLSFMEERGLDFPVVLKPDVGERGAGVAIVRTPEELEAYLRAATGDTIVQEYLEGLEFGVFYYRHPEEPTGRLFSITEKRFPVICGDGWSTVEELILRDPRAFCLASLYLGRVAYRPSWTPAAGEAVRLVEIGSHCRGAVFLDGSGLRTPDLEEAVERIAKGHPGFFFGRFDVRAPSVEAFQNGQFRVIELNGVSAEATHIYDPAVPLVEAYRVLFAQWRIAFAIGAANRRAGAEPLPVAKLVQLIWRQLFRARPVDATDFPSIRAEYAQLLPDEGDRAGETAQQRQVLTV